MTVKETTLRERKTLQIDVIRHALHTNSPDDDQFCFRPDIAQLLREIDARDQKSSQ